MRQPILIACSLSPGERSDRRLEFAAVAERIVGREPTERGVRVRFRDVPGFQEELADLIRREKECCPFYDFRISAVDGEVLLEVDAPPEAQPIIDQLFSAETR
jgi:hypothetical protein